TAARVYTMVSEFTVNGNLDINPNAASAYNLSVLSKYTSSGDNFVTGNTTLARTGSATASFSIVDGMVYADFDTGTLTIGTGTTFVTGDQLNITGSGTPFVMNGTFTINATISDVIYAGTSATNIGAAIYPNLAFTPAPGT